MLSFSISVPATKLAVQAYTNQKSRSIGYSVYYIVYFSSGAIAGLLIDLVFTLQATNMNSFRILFSISTGMLFVSGAVSLKLRQLDANNRGEEEMAIKEKKMSAWKHNKDILELKLFWRYLSVVLIFVLSSTVFYHLGVTLPVFMYREISNGAHFGYMMVVNNLVMIFGTPLFTVLVYYFTPFSLLILGSTISAASPFIFIFGSGYEYVTIFVVVLSIGESISAPRLIEYTLSVAPKGKEGVFLAVGTSPLWLGLILCGLSAGPLLSEFCPEHGERKCWIMWVIIGSIALLSPLALFFLRQFLEQPLFEPQPYIFKSKEKIILD
jgi:hypothetical protein